MFEVTCCEISTQIQNTRSCASNSYHIAIHSQKARKLCLHNHIETCTQRGRLQRYSLRAAGVRGNPPSGHSSTIRIMCNLITLPADSILKGIEKHDEIPAIILQRFFCVRFGTLDVTVGTTLGPLWPPFGTIWARFGPV